MKRLFDLIVSSLGLVLFSPIALILALAIKLDSRGPIFYRGERLGKDARVFRIFKFRTMVADARSRGGGITVRDDPRITRVGRFLRRSKLDELPQLINVWWGDMSLVGPRPEDPRYLQFYTPPQRQVLSVRPGITSISALRFRNEADLLPPDQWESVYIETILPTKLSVELNYLGTRSFSQDLLILFATLFVVANIDTRFDRWIESTGRLEESVGRYISWIFIDIVLIVAAYALAIGIRSLNTTLHLPLAFVEALLGVSIYIALNQLFHIYHRFWRYASAREAVTLFASIASGTIVISILASFLHERALPFGAIWLGGLLTFLFLTAARYRRHLYLGGQQLMQDVLKFASSKGARVLIVGAGDEGQLLAWQLQNRMQGKAYDLIGFVDDDRQKHGVRIHNAPVYGGRDKIPALVNELHIDLIILAIPAYEMHEPRELLALCRNTAAQIKVLPGLFDWLDKARDNPNWVDLSEDYLLQRAPNQVNHQAIRNLIHGRVVMVTGAAGSIGSELCHQLALHQPACLAMLDINESGLYDLNVELHAEASALATRLILCDISDENRLRNVFEDLRPEIIFHAAAYKHVPVLEQFPHEAVRVNVLGTRLLYQNARRYGAHRFVFISSDKAVNPTNMLGLTKWLGEVMITAETRSPRLLATAVRFGNVLGSRGSVVPTFARQIELGGPITITDAEMTRYFLSIGEAVSLVTQAATLTRGGDIFVLDMGVPIKILQLAHRMIRQRGLRPDKDIEIKFVGLRPGEKMSEELVAGHEETLPTEHASISRIRRTTALDLNGFSQRLDELIALSQNGAPADLIRHTLVQLVEELQSPPAPISAGLPFAPTTLDAQVTV